MGEEGNLCHGINPVLISSLRAKSTLGTPTREESLKANMGLRDWEGATRVSKMSAVPQVFFRPFFIRILH